MLMCNCRAKDSRARVASAWRLVQVQQQYAISLTVPLSLLVTSSEDADAKAAALTAGTNATDALAVAFTAGLISGAVCTTTTAYMSAGLCTVFIHRFSKSSALRLLHADHNYHLFSC